MRTLRRGSIAILSMAALFSLGVSFDGLSAGPPPAAAQGTLTPPAGQPRVTAPGALRGRALRHHRRFHHAHRRRR
jgi:hypothetical protein